MESKLTSKKSWHRKDENFVIRRSWRGHCSLRRRNISKSTVSITKFLFGLGGIKIRHTTKRFTFVRFLCNHFHACHQKDSPWSKFFLPLCNDVTKLFCSHRFRSQKNRQNKMRLCFILLLGEHIKRFPRETKITSELPIHVLSHNNVYNYFSITY